MLTLATILDFRLGERRTRFFSGCYFQLDGFIRWEATWFRIQS
jgi:hypothetical protein